MASENFLLVSSSSAISELPRVSAEGTLSVEAGDAQSSFSFSSPALGLVSGIFGWFSCFQGYKCSLESDLERLTSGSTRREISVLMDFTRLSRGLPRGELLSLGSRSVEEDLTRLVVARRPDDEVNRSAKEPGDEGE